METRQFNSRGQLTRQTGSDGVVTLFQYNPRGEIEYTVLDMDRDGVIDFSGEDRIVRTQTGVSTARGTASIWTATYVHREMNSDTGRLDNVIERSVNGRDVWETKNGISNPVHTTESIEPNGDRVVTVTRPDQTSTASVYTGDRLSKVMEYDSTGSVVTQVTYGYDAHGRLESAVDTRSGETLYAYNDADEVVSVTAPAHAQGGVR